MDVDFLLRTLGWLLFAWTVPNMIGLGILWSQTLKNRFLGEKATFKDGWKAHGFLMLFLFAACLTFWYHLVFVWT